MMISEQNISDQAKTVFQFFNNELSYLSLATNKRKFLMAYLPILLSFLCYMAILVYIQQSAMASSDAMLSISVLLVFSFLPIGIARIAHQRLLKRKFPHIFNEENQLDHGRLEEFMQAKLTDYLKKIGLSNGRQLIALKEEAKKIQRKLQRRFNAYLTIIITLFLSSWSLAMDFIFQDVNDLGLKLLGVSCVTFGVAVHACIFYADMDKKPPFQFSNYKQLISLLNCIQLLSPYRSDVRKPKSTPDTKTRR